MSNEGNGNLDRHEVAGAFPSDFWQISLHKLGVHAPAKLEHTFKFVSRKGRPKIDLCPIWVHIGVPDT